MGLPNPSEQFRVLHDILDLVHKPDRPVHLSEVAAAIGKANLVACQLGRNDLWLAGAALELEASTELASTFSLAFSENCIQWITHLIEAFHSFYLTYRDRMVSSDPLPLNSGGRGAKKPGCKERARRALVAARLALGPHITHAEALAWATKQGTFGPLPKRAETMKRYTSGLGKECG